MSRIPFGVHLWCMLLLRKFEEANPLQPIGMHFSAAQRYVSDRVSGAASPADVQFYTLALRHLKSGCPTPRLDNVTALSTLCGGMTLHA